MTIEDMTIKVLLVEDDEDDYVLLRALLNEIKVQRFQLDWKRNFKSGLEAMLNNQHDICLVDYRLGRHSGIELLRAAIEGGCQMTVLLLTGSKEHEIDVAAMDAGAADYLVKGKLDSDALERSMRYALQRRKAAAQAAFEQARLAAFGAQVGLALTKRAPLDAILEQCAQAMNQYLDGVLAQISTFDAATGAFHCRGSAGGAGAQASEIPLPQLDPGLLVEGKSVLIKQLLNDDRMKDQEWLKRHGLVSYAACPLILDDKLIGLMSIFARQPLHDNIGQELSSVANGIALCIERKRSEEALGASEHDRKQAEEQIQKLAAFPRVNPNPVLEFAGDGSLTYANDAARNLAKSLGREDLLSVLPPNAGEIAKECVRTAQKQLREEVAINGRTITWSFFPVPGNQVAHCYGADITDMLSLEAQFRHAQKLESVGQLAAGVAHDFNNILTVIQGYADCLLARGEGDQITEKALRQIHDASRRAAALTRQLLMFSRKQIIQSKVLDLNEVLRNLAHMLQRLLGETISLQTDFSAKLPLIEADTSMMEQVVMNLAVNSRDAMPKGGKLLIATSAVELDEEYARHHPDSRPGKFVCLSVTDTGCGMDRKTMDRIFEPFFSTKEVGKGTGLGLATVYGIVKQHEGWVEVTSELGQGTTFRIYLPQSARSEPATEAALAQTADRGRGETILLVEDEADVRELAREILSGYNYKVLEAGSGVEALGAWDAHNGNIDLLLTDIVMPQGMTGTDLAAQLRKRKPGLKVIYSSGYSSEVTAGELTQGDAIFLAKPYPPAQLAQIVRQSLRGTPDTGQIVVRT
jgi:signal transduction histidine kinase/DNA-binding response OmpR family regulator